MERQTVTKVPTTPTRDRSVQRQSAEPSTAQSLQSLQRTIGNQAVQRLIRSPFIQRKLNCTSCNYRLQRQESEETAMPPEEETVQRASISPLSPHSRPEDEDEEARNRTAGQKAVQRVQRQPLASSTMPPVQLQADEAEEEVQMKAAHSVVQRQEQDDEVLQGKFESVQRQNVEEEDSVQGKFAGGGPPNQPTGSLGNAENRSGGLPGPLRAGLEMLSGRDLSGVRVHYNAPEPAQLNALAYTQGQDIHVGPGQEKHLAHEGWHAVQQLEGRVRPQMKVKGIPLNDDDGLEKEADVMGAKALQMARGPINLAEFSIASSADRHLSHTHSATSTGGPIQKTTAGGITVKDMKFAPKEIPLDGAATSQATVHYSGRIAAGAKINWSIIGASFGSVIDAGGKITAGAAPLLPGKEKERLKVKAEDNGVPAAHTFGILDVWDKEFFQAKKDFPLFNALKLTQDPFTPGTFGKLALEYSPKNRRLDATVRIKFIFLDDLPGAALWKATTKNAYQAKFINTVQGIWSNKYQFANVREPQKIWKKLNPVSVRVRAVLDTTGAPHQTITVHKKAIGAQTGVGGVVGQVRFGKGDETPQAAFNPNVGAGELAQLGAVTPTPILFAAGKSDISAVDKPKLQFMATYLHRIKNPRFTVAITGHHQQVVHPPGATAAQKTAAINAAKQLSRQRAKEVFNVLKAGSATFHKITTQGVGDTGAAAAAAWDKAVITSALPPGFKNIQNVLGHEFGHMLGLGDEYATGAKPAGTPTTHYLLTKQAFGTAYADAQAKRVGFRASIMAHGTDVRPHHYVRFWDGLAQMTSAAALPKKPFVHADWKFVGQ